MSQASILQAKLLPNYLATVKTIKGLFSPTYLSCSSSFVLLPLISLLFSFLLFSSLSSPPLPSPLLFPFSLSSPLLSSPLSLLLSSYLAFPLLAFQGDLSLSSTFSLSPCLSIIKL
jgi:hypothetical protein